MKQRKWNWLRDVVRLTESFPNESSLSGPVWRQPGPSQPAGIDARLSNVRLFYSQVLWR